MKYVASLLFLMVVLTAQAVTTLTHTLATSTVTITNASPAVITWTGHNQVPTAPIVFTTTVALPTGLTAGTRYYIIPTGITVNTFQVSATVGGSAINTSSGGSGVQTATTGIAYDFDADYVVGTYANGDDYVVAPSGINITGKFPMSMYTAGITQAATITIATPAVVSITAHGLTQGQPFKFRTTGALPTGLIAGRTYYVGNNGFTVNSFQVTTTYYGTAVNTSGTQSGIQSVEIGRTVNGSMLNMVLGTAFSQGLDSAMFAQYQFGNGTTGGWVPTLNVARPMVANIDTDLSVGNPMPISPVSVLWSAISVPFPSSAVPSAAASINTQSGAAYTFVLGDIGMKVSMTSGSACAITIPPEVTTNFPIGTILYCARNGSGALTVTPGAGVTFQSYTSLTPSINANIGFQKLSSDLWMVGIADLRPQQYDAAVLAVVSTAPSSGAFRPPLYGTDKTTTWNKSQLDYTILRSLSTAGVSGVPSLATVEAEFTRNWLFFHTSSFSQYASPVVGNPSGTSGLYGREVAEVVSDGLLTLNLNYTNLQKEPTYIKLVQMGIDIYGGMQSGNGSWPIGTGIFADLSGINNGRKAPMVLAALALNDANILAWCNGANHFIFSEDRQIWTVSQTDVGRAVSQTDGNFRYTYTYDDVGCSEAGEQHIILSTLDGRNWNPPYLPYKSYRDIQGASYLGNALGIGLITGGVSAWAWAPFFDYALNRYAANQITNQGSPVPAFHASMWTNYRSLITTPAATTKWNDGPYLKAGIQPGTPGLLPGGF